MFDRNVDNSLSAFINCCGVNDEKTTSLVDYFNIELDIRTIDDLKELDSFEDSIYDAGKSLTIRFIATAAKTLRLFVIMQ